MLTVYPPPSPPARRAKRDAAGPTEDISTRPEPIPLFYRPTEHEGNGIPYTDTHITWRNEDGLRCRHCEPDKCNFIPGAEGVGGCVLRRAGRLADAVPLPSRRLR